MAGEIGISENFRSTTGELRPRGASPLVLSHVQQTSRGDVITMSYKRSALLPIGAEAPQNVAPLKRQKFSSEVKTEARLLHAQGIPRDQALQRLEKFSGQRISAKNFSDWTKPGVVLMDRGAKPAAQEVQLGKISAREPFDNPQNNQRVLLQPIAERNEPPQESHALKSAVPYFPKAVSDQAVQRLNWVYIIKRMLVGQPRTVIMKHYEAKFGKRISENEFDKSMQLYTCLQSLDLEHLSEEAVVRKTGLTIVNTHILRSSIGSWLYHRNYSKHTIHQVLADNARGSTDAKIRSETGILQRDIMALVAAYKRIRTMQRTGEHRHPLEPADEDSRCMILQKEFTLGKNKMLTPQALENLWEYVRDYERINTLPPHVAANQDNG